MNVERIVDKFAGFFSWLYYRRWEKWELAAIAIVALLILISIIRARLKVAASEKRLRERSPIVGVKMARHGRKHYI
jgi:hypothetical protein